MPKSILLVDDNPSIRAVTRISLETHPGFTICGEAADGVEAVEKALELSPDLIVMDLSMPRMNGIEAAREVKGKLCHVQIVLFTLHRNAVKDSDASAAGISSIVSKLEGKDLLIAEIERLLKTRQAGGAGFDGRR
jgi:DNA-binding NarL/FixJ family response regulator